MLTASIIMSRWQTKKFTTQGFDHLCFEQIWTQQICSALDCGADCINEALIGLTTTVAIATKPHQSHNVASSLMMFLILSHDLVTSESKATFNPHCGFSFNEVSDFSTDTSHHLQTAYCSQRCVQLHVHTQAHTQVSLRVRFITRTKS